MFRILELLVDPIARFIHWPWPWPCLSCPPDVGNPIEEIISKMFG